MFSGCKLRDVLMLWRRFNQSARKLAPVYRRSFTSLSDSKERCQASLYTASRKLVGRAAESVESVSSTLQRQSDIQQCILSLEHNLKKINRVCKTDLLNILDKMELKDFPSQDDNFWLLLLKCCGHVMPDVNPPVRMELAYRCWEKLEKIKGVPLPIELHNEILRRYVDNAPDGFSVAKFLESLGETSPDEQTYDLLLEIATSEGDLKQMVEVVSLMKHRGLPAKEHTFNNLLRCHAKRRDKKSFQQTLDTMRLTQLPLTAETFSCIIVGFCEAGDVEQALKTFEDARAADVCLTEDHVVAIVRTAAKTGDDRLLQEVLRQAQARTLPLSASVVNLVVHLANTGFERAACLLFHEVTFSVPPDSLETVRSSFGVFLLQELVKTNTSVEMVKDLCTKLEDSGQNEWATSKAIEAALIFGRMDLAVSLMEDLGSKGRPLRQHYFWPLLLMAGRQQGEGGATEVLRHMQRLGLRPDYETLTDYFLPHVSLVDVNVAVRKLQDQGLGVSEVAPAVLVTLLRNGHLQGAVTLFSTLKFRTNWRQLVRPLASAFLSSTDVPGTVALLKLAREARPSDSDRDLVGQFVLEVASSKKSRLQAEQLLALLKGLQQEKLHTSASFAANVRRRIHFLSQDEATTKALQSAIDQLTSATSEEEDTATSFNGLKINPHPRDMNLEELECHLIELRSKNMNTRGVLRRLLQEYCRVKAFNRALEVAQSLSESGLEFSAGMLSSLLKAYSSTNKLKEAQDCLDQLRTNFPSFSIDAYKVADLASQLVLDDSYKAAILLLEKHGTLKLAPNVKAHLSRNCWKLLCVVAEKCRAEETRQLLELLVRLGYCDVTNVLLGPLIKAHLDRDDVAGAVSEYKRCVLQHRMTPLQHELLCAVCRRGDKELLETVSGLTGSVHGRDSFSVSLAAAYAETELTEQLKSLLQEGVRWPLLLLRCKHFVEEDKLRPLQNIAEALGNLHRAAVPLYTLMMQILYRRRDREGANMLWQKLQEEDVVPEQEFVTMVTDLLKRGGIESGGKQE